MTSIGHGGDMRTTLFMAAEHRCGAEQVSAYEMKAYRSHVDPDFPRGGRSRNHNQGRSPSRSMG
jgi:hypothetical protein